MKHSALLKWSLAILFCILFCCGAAAAEEPMLIFSLESGFYAEEQELTITCNVEDSVIFYTTDGSIPTEDSEVLDYALELTDTTDLPNVLSAIGGTNPEEEYTPAHNVMKAHVIRAMAWLPDDTYTPVYNATYWIGADREELYGDLPIISMMMDYEDLFDYENGIYILGKAYDDYMQNISTPLDVWEYPANYQARGREGERLAAIEYLPFEGEGFSLDMGVRIKGGASRTNNHKSLRLIAREEYGQKALTYPVFENNLRQDGTGLVEKYKSITLRAGGNDTSFAVIRDPLIQNLATGLRFTTQANTPCILFINGEFWGLKTITEEYSDNYLQYNYGVDNKNVVMVKNGELEEGEDEDMLLFEEMFDYIATSDMSDPANYQQACEMLDVGGLADLTALHLYIFNKDGIFENNNWMMWRARETDASNPVADGKWRFLGYDVDFCAGVYDEGKTHSVDNITEVLLADAQYEGRHTALLVRSLWQNPDFRQELLTALCDVRNIYFDARRFGDHFNAMRSAYEPYMPETFRRFGPAWVSTWDPAGHLDRQLNGLALFFSKRHMNFPWLMQDAFDLSTPVEVTVSVSDPAKGSVVLNGDRLDEFMPRKKGFTGMYFPEYPITLTAEPAEGVTFVGWQAKGCTLADPSAATIEVTLTDKVSLTAMFE